MPICTPKRLLLLLALLTGSRDSSAQQKINLDSRASVIFPGKTKEIPTETGPVTVSMLDKANKITGTATRIDATTFGIDSSTIAANYNNTAFIELILQGLLGQYPGVTVISRKKIARGKQMGYEVTLQKDKPDETVPYKNLYVQVLFAGARIYALTALAEEGADATEVKETFFNSLKID